MIRTLFLILCICQLSISNAQVSLRQLSPENGKYMVGFKHFTAADSTRTYRRIFDWNHKSLPRPIPISIWYPATDDEAQQQLTMLDYMQILKEEEE
ncbi:hypothetical protein [Chitinophaga cymbidii]|uniref:hypothetical protein n=1 Tax=Chitinophaga cymbidii TaxID=1096750 RepID=UPI0011BE5DFB|nr:hypothetical protein [Chitinophaga cymbidii]